MASEAFKQFDQDEDGFITSAEMVTVLVNGSDMSEADANDYFKMFDKDEDDKLCLSEFEDAWSMFGSFLQSAVTNWDFKQVEKTKELYQKVIAPYQKKVEDTFAKLDLDKDGVLSIDELRDVLMAVQGAEFSEEAFFRWHDVHGRERHFGSGGKVDLQEFGWYMADCAECQAGKMDLIVNEFVEAAGTVRAQFEAKRAELKKSEPRKQYAFVKPKSFLRLPTFSKKAPEAGSASEAGELTLKDVIVSEQALADALVAACGDADKAENLLFGAMAKLRVAKAAELAKDVAASVDSAPAAAVQAVPLAALAALAAEEPAEAPAAEPLVA